MKKKALTTNGKLIIALSRSMQKIHRKSDLLFHQNGLTMTQFAVLEALLNKGDLTIGGLIEAVLSTSGNMTVVIRNLEKLGYVHRMENPQDKRSFLISLTETGRLLIEGMFSEHMVLVEESLSPLADNEKETIISILKKL